MSSEPDGIVVVGAGLAGLRTAAALRSHGYAGRLTIVGDEPHHPYDRPPLSKEVLVGRRSAADTLLPLPEDLEARWILGRSAISLNRAQRSVDLDDGTRLRYRALVIATGASARTWPGPAAPPAAGVHTLRRLQDALALQAALARGGPLLVIGAGFIGSEVASSARELDVPVTLVDTVRWPMGSAIGSAAGAFIARIQRRSGVDLRLGTAVAEFTGGHVLTGARLTDGTYIPAKAALLSLGAVPNTGWLRSSGLRLGGGVACDTRCRPLTTGGTPAERIVAVGDVAALPVPTPARGKGRLAHMATGHWSDATAQAEIAAATLLRAEATEAGLPAFSFWSDQFGLRIRSVGLPRLADQAEVHEQDVDRRRLEVSYRREGRLIGALVVNRPSRLSDYRTRLAAEEGHSVK